MYWLITAQPSDHFSLNLKFTGALELISNGVGLQRRSQCLVEDNIS